MKEPELRVEGKVHTDKITLERFNHDASSYRIQPQLVVEPANEEDVLKVIEYARNNGNSLTCRAGGSGLSGAGIGPGIILNFKPLMNRIRRLEEKIVAEPGVVLEDFLQDVNQRGMMLPAVPSSSAWCALGGNVGTRSTGPRTARYGTIDAFVESLKFVTAGGEVVDTARKLPPQLEDGIIKIRERYLTDTKSRKLFEGRPFIAGGYNIGAFSKYEDPADIAAHLMVGSIGTLGIVTEIRLRLAPLRPSQMTYAAFFRSIDEVGAAVNAIRNLRPAAVEFVDAATMTRVRGRILKIDKTDVAGALLVEFDESREQAEQGRRIFESFDSYDLISIAVDSPQEKGLWEERRRILPSLEAYARKKGWIVPSIIDDVAIHVSDFAAVYKDLRKLMADLNHEICIFGHLGFGSLHARPFFEPEKKDVAEQILEASRRTFHLLQKYGGTLVGEHNAGRSRSVYLEMELSDSFRYLRDIKNLFDPEDLLNPNTLFNLAPITENMGLTH